ncbi:unnamed protein product [Cercopithifilaria johnstoni]|uniref:Major sperm protein n=1 Tax=Cercopithifilaria johnstoni TaxID=2874296 RepID=A0A8J2LZQ3_9BILA|nr:unnamed protein product [Cercopithifilaria johnstoni]
MESIDDKYVLSNNTLSGNTRHLNQLKRNAREWIANKQSRYERTSEDVTSDTVGFDETTLNSLKTISKENCNVTGLNIIKLNPAVAATTTAKTHSVAQLCTSRTAKSGKMTEDEKIETTERSLTSVAATAKTFESQQPSDCTGNPTSSIEGLVSFPDSQVIIRNGHVGPVILAFTNNYKKSIIWALKTNAMRRLAAFPTTGIIPPSETVQIKIDLIGEMPKRNSKDRLSLEYFVSDQKIANDGNRYNFFHYNELTRMKKCLEVIYIQ